MQSYSPATPSIKEIVTILVLVEYSLQFKSGHEDIDGILVTILVLVEYSLQYILQNTRGPRRNVTILVLVEYSLQ